MIDRSEIGESSPFAGEYRSKRDQQKVETLKKAGMVIQGAYDNNGERTTIKFVDRITGTSRDIPVTADRRNFGGEVYTAYVPSRRDMAAIRRAVMRG